MKNYKRNFYLSLVVGVLACASLAWYAYNQHHTVALRDLQILSITDTLTLFKTKDGRNGAYIRVIEGSKKEVLAIVEKQDKRIYQLVKETKGLRSLTTHDVITKTDTTVRIDTLRLPTETKPLYINKHISDEYYDAYVIVKGDSLTLRHTSYNEFDYMLKDNKAKGLFGFLKPTTYVVQAINLNPNTTTRSLRTLEIKPKNKTGLKIGIGVAAGVAAVLLLK